MANEKKFVAAFFCRGVDNEEVVGFNRPGYQSLADQYFVGAAQDITQPCSAFKVQMLRCFKHLSAQTVKQVLAFTTKKCAYLFDHVGIFRRIKTAPARARPAIEM